MRKEKRINKDGTSYYSFLYSNSKTGKRVRLSRDYLRKRFGRDMVTEEDADECMKILDAEFETQAYNMEKRLNWEKEYYNFSDLLQSYTEKQKKKAPNSWKNNVHYLKYYVLHYFLMEAKCNNIDFWFNHYEPFIDWLETKAYLIKKPHKIISYGAKNHCIKALNTFLRHLHSQKIVQTLILCERFPSHLLGERTIDDVISVEEMEAVYQRLKFNGHDREALFYRTLYFTGMRFNEGLGLSLADMFTGKVQESHLTELLKRYQIAYNGYFVLSSQPDHETLGLFP